MEVKKLLVVLLEYFEVVIYCVFLMISGLGLALRILIVDK